MDTLKTRTANQITSYLISFQYFVHPPGVTSTPRYRVLIDNMCLWIYHCGMAAQIWGLFYQTLYTRFLSKFFVRRLYVDRVINMFVAKNKLRIRKLACKSYACPTPVVRTSQVSWRTWKVSLKQVFFHLIWE